MTDTHRRRALQTATAMTVGAVAGCAAPGLAGNTPKTPFNVPDTTIPVAGTDLQFPVRRIYCIGRNYAAHAREMGDEKKPWEIGKSFDRSAPIGPLHLAAQTGHFTRGAIWLKVNGQTKQNANLNQMIWNVAEQISRLSTAFELMAGDIIFSGTPENVGPVVRGDVIECHIDGLPNLSVKIV